MDDIQMEIRNRINTRSEIYDWNNVVHPSLADYTKETFGEMLDDIDYFEIRRTRYTPQAFLKAASHIYFKSERIGMDEVQHIEWPMYAVFKDGSWCEWDYSFENCWQGWSMKIYYTPVPSQFDVNTCGILDILRLEDDYPYELYWCYDEDSQDWGWYMYDTDAEEE